MRCRNKQMSRSPEKPWVPGTHPTYSAFRLQVNVCQDQHGNVWSDHDFATPADMSVAQSLRQGGAPQVAHALLTEAIRREAFMCALIAETKEKGFLARYKASSAEEKLRVEAELQGYATHVITQALGKMTPGAVAEVLAMMADQS